MINKLYSYMHDIFGAEVIELFDMEYDPQEKHLKKETQAQAVNPKQADGAEKTEQAQQAESVKVPAGEDT